MLDYGYRSKCCKAPIKIVFKKSKLTNIRKSVWACVKCKKSDIEIISKDELKIQSKN